MIEITQYGFPMELLKSFPGTPARVIAVHRGECEIVCPMGFTRAKLKGAAQRALEEKGMFPAVGDYVWIQYNPSGDSLILDIAPRKSKFARSNFSGHAAGYAKTIIEQVVAANFDYVLILSSLNYDLNLRRIERYIAQATQSGGTPCVILTKTDLMDNYDEQLKSVKDIAGEHQVFAVSAKTGEGLDALKTLLAPGKTVVLLGSSGVGKSSLINALEGEEVMKVKEIRTDDSKGRHTTTHRQMLLLKSGALMIDTPGMRELGMWESKDGLSETFPDVEPFLNACKFANCTHGSEPGCAVRDGLESGALNRERWHSYLQLTKELAFTGGKAPSPMKKSPKKAHRNRYIEE